METLSNVSDEMATALPIVSKSYSVEAPYTVANSADDAKKKRKSTAKCKACHVRLGADDLRVVNMLKSPFDKTGNTLIRVCHHVKCIFNRFKRSKPTTEKVTQETDLIGFEKLNERDKAVVRGEIESLKAYIRDPKTGPPPPPKRSTRGGKRKADEDIEKMPPKKSKKELAYDDIQISRAPSEDLDDTTMTFEEFCELCDRIAAENKNSGKTTIVSEALMAEGDILPVEKVSLIVRMLLPKYADRKYNMSQKRLIKIFAEIFGADAEEMKAELKQSGDVSTVVAKRSLSSLGRVERPAYLCEVERFLVALDGLSKESEQLPLVRKQVISSFTTEKQVMYFVRLINGDLRIKAGERQVFDGVSRAQKKNSKNDVSAFQCFSINRDVDDAVKTAMSSGFGSNSAGDSSLAPAPKLFTPVFPMQADACKSVDAAFKKAKKIKTEDDMFAEVQYDGERVQIHVDFEAGRFAFFSRKSKPILPHKLGGEDMREALRRAFPEVKNIILDSEVLLVSDDSGENLSFVPLGKNKEDWEGKVHTRLNVFDLLLYNDQNLINRPFTERRALLEKLMGASPRVTVPKLDRIEGEEHLLALIDSALKEGRGGLMIKNGSGVYAPGQKHWLKIRKGFLNNGVMADTVDLAVLGAWYGTGKKSDKLSVFLMCCLDKETGEWKTVTKVHAGLDAKALERLQGDLKGYMEETPDVVETKGIRSATKPDWMACEPNLAKIWEIGGTQFFKADGKDTANGISIRSPRVVRERPDKDWTAATTMAELEELYKNSVSRISSDSSSADSSDSEKDERT